MTKTQKALTWYAVVLMTLICVGILVIAFKPRGVPVGPTTEGAVVVDASGQERFGGWYQDDEVIAANLNPLVTSQFDNTPAGKAALGDDDVFLWEAVRKVNNRGPPWYPNIDQGPVGSCVGAGNKHGADVCQAMQIVNGLAAEWKPISVESIYGPSRVEIGGGRIRGDGSVGAWAIKSMETIGTLAMQAYEGHDLTTYSPDRARAWGRSGMPNELEPIAKQHPVKGSAVVKNWADVKRAIQQGYPVVVCSNRGFTMNRDADGFCRPSGTWAHCMVIIGLRTTKREGGFILNSWGDQAHRGPVWPEHAPVAGFWADPQTIESMVRQGDSFALADIVGFPARQLPDWWIAAPRAPRDRFAFAEFPLAH